MPLYVYKRLDGTTFEVMQKITDPPLAHDPKTNEPVTRVLFPPQIIFKGSGFHNTDYKTKPRKMNTKTPSEK